MYIYFFKSYFFSREEVETVRETAEVKSGL